MLFNLQSEKVNKIILCPIIVEIREIYNQLGFSIELIKKMFDNISIRKIKRNRKESYGISLSIKDQYHCRGMLLVTRLNEFPYSDTAYKQEEKILYEKIREYFKNNDEEMQDRMCYELNFETILKVASKDEVLDSLKWFDDQLNFAFDILKKYEKENISRKKKVASILEEL